MVPSFVIKPYLHLTCIREARPNIISTCLCLKVDSVLCAVINQKLLYNAYYSS